MNFSNHRSVGFPGACLPTRIAGEPYSGNLCLSFDEGPGFKAPVLLYRV